MKKSLSKILARMAKDGDIETVAEIIEEMIESESPETPEEAIAEAVAETIVPAAAEIAEETETAPEEAARNRTRTAGEESSASRTARVQDEATLADIVSRLDRIIELLTPGPASDEDPIEEIAEAVEEAIEAATAEEEPVADEETGEILDPEEIAEIVEEILEPVPAEALSEVLDPVEDECGEEEEEETLTTGDALRVALKAVRPALMKMPRKQRMRVSKDIAAKLQWQNRHRGADAGIYAAIAGNRRKAPRKNPAELGKRIMASRNINCRK